MAGGCELLSSLLVIYFLASYVLNIAVRLVSTCHGGASGKMLDVLTWILWAALGGYSFWLVTRAKTSQPLTLDELVILWKKHKQEAKCRAPLSRVKPIIDPRSDQFSGFKCECGYQYTSKRLLVQRRAADRNMLIALSSSKSARATDLLF